MQRKLQFTDNQELKSNCGLKVYDMTTCHCANTSIHHYHKLKPIWLH